MVAAPTETPVTTPEALTVAIAVVPLLHVPPGVDSPNGAVLPTHTLTAVNGVMAAGAAATVTGALTMQLPMEYDIVAVPAASPVTVPLTTVATPGALLVHIPPPVASVNDIVVPAHIAAETGANATGPGLTVTDSVATQAPTVYEMITTPAFTP